MTELVTGVIVVMFLAAFTYAGFLAGRERSEAKCHNTIANLRRANMALRARLDRTEERNRRLARALSDYNPPAVELPEWMKP